MTTESKARYAASARKLGEAILDRFGLLDDQQIIEEIDRLITDDQGIKDTLKWCKENVPSIPDYSMESEHKTLAEELGIWIGALVIKYERLLKRKKPAAPPQATEPVCNNCGEYVSQGVVMTACPTCDPEKFTMCENCGLRVIDCGGCL